MLRWFIYCRRSVMGGSMKPSMAGVKMLLVCGNVHDNKRGVRSIALREYFYNIHKLSEMLKSCKNYAELSVQIATKEKACVRCFMKQCIPESRWSTYLDVVRRILVSVHLLCWSTTNCSHHPREREKIIINIFLNSQ